MSQTWKYQIRATLTDAAAEAYFDESSISPIHEIALRHGAGLISPYDAFVTYCFDAEQQGVEQFPLYRRTRAAIEDPIKAAKYRKVVTFYVDGEQLYPRAVADALEAELSPLVGGGLIEKIDKYGSNPVNSLLPLARLQA
jgi:hypothetical protein